MSQNSLKQNLQAVIGWMESKKIIKKDAKGRIQTSGTVSKFNNRKRR